MDLELFLPIININVTRKPSPISQEKVPLQLYKQFQLIFGHTTVINLFIRWIIQVKEKCKLIYFFFVKSKVVSFETSYVYFSKFYGKVGVISWLLFHLIWKNYVLYWNFDFKSWIVDFYTRFFMSETSEKIHNSTFRVKISVLTVIFSNEMEK